MGSYRAPVDEEVVEFREIKDQAFYAKDGPTNYEAPSEVPETNAERRGIFVDEELVSVCSLYPFTANVSGEWQSLTGVGGVSTPPHHRSKGYARELLTGVLRELLDQGTHYSALWPVSYPYYRSLGWGLAHLESHYEFPPDALQNATGSSNGEFAQIKPPDIEQLVSVYESEVGDFILGLERSPDWWEERVLSNSWAYCWTPDGAESAEGYIVYSVEEESQQSTLVIEELVYQTESARQQLLRLIYQHTSQVEVIRWECPAESHLLLSVPDPAQITCTIEPGAMFRIVDVEAALDRLQPPAVAETYCVHIEVNDPLVEANEGVFALQMSSTEVTCHRDSSETAGVDIDIDILSRLYVGATSIDEIESQCSIDLADHQRKILAEVFPNRQVYMTDFF